jgi:hypothetical protein
VRAQVRRLDEDDGRGAGDFADYLIRGLRSSELSGMKPSSEDLHAQGARFVLERDGESYRVRAFLAGGETSRSTLSLSA